MGLARLAHGLGSSTKGTQMGESAHGVAIHSRSHAGHQAAVQESRGGNHFRRKARIRVLCNGTTGEKIRAQSICQQFLARARPTETHQDEIKGTATILSLGVQMVSTTHLSRLFVIKATVHRSSNPWQASTVHSSRCATLS